MSLDSTVTAGPRLLLEMLVDLVRFEISPLAVAISFTDLVRERRGKIGVSELGTTSLPSEKTDLLLFAERGRVTSSENTEAVTTSLKDGSLLKMLRSTIGGKIEATFV